MRSRDSLPEICRQTCIAANNSKVDEAPLFFSANCDGPAPSADGTIHEEVHVEIETGQAWLEEPASKAVQSGHLVCRNLGLNHSMRALLAEAE